MLKKFLRNRDGATAVEYGLIVGVLSLAIVGGVGMLMNSVGNNFDFLSGLIDAAVDNADN